MRAGPALHYRIVAALLIIALATATVSSVASPGFWRACVGLTGAVGAIAGVTWMWRQDREAS